MLFPLQWKTLSETDGFFLFTDVTQLLMRIVATHSILTTIHPFRVRVSVMLNFLEVVFISGLMK